MVYNSATCHLSRTATVYLMNNPPAGETVLIIALKDDVHSQLLCEIADFHFSYTPVCISIVVLNKR